VTITRQDILATLAERGLTGLDAETALDAWRFNPLGADGGRVQATLAHVASREEVAR
jgi:hypothetical protein